MINTANFLLKLILGLINTIAKSMVYRSKPTNTKYPKNGSKKAKDSNESIDNFCTSEFGIKRLFELSSVM